MRARLEPSVTIVKLERDGIVFTVKSSDGFSMAYSSDTLLLDHGKMFIGGLSWQTTTEGLRQYFCQFGELADCMVMKDPVTKRSRGDARDAFEVHELELEAIGFIDKENSVLQIYNSKELNRGFGFINYTDPDSVDKVLACGPHTLDTTVVDPKVAVPKSNSTDVPIKGAIGEFNTSPKMVTRTKKIFIGGLSASTTVDDIRNYFEQHGKVEDCMLMFDKQTQRHRGFAFVTFESEEVVDKVVEQHFHEINNKLVECKKAQPKEVMLTQGLAKGIVPIGLPQTYYAAIGGRSYQLAGLPAYYYASGLPTYSYLPAAALAGISPGAQAIPTATDRLTNGTPAFYTPAAPDYTAAAAAANQLTTNQVAAAMGHVLALPAPRAPEANASPAQRDQFIIQRTLSGGLNMPAVAATTPRGGILSLQDCASTDLVLNGYASSFASPTSPIASPISSGLYGPGLGALGYVQAASPPHASTAYPGSLIHAGFQNGYH